ncbi:MAG: hypothetical protein JNK84_17850 [Phreatobacter sp.]|uniref:hypothetical protein n=1 Tax=Phreatobacter sp. TaxID=1966341 RepID=UPI001A5676E3|nr:hypothetical protein [Phreatobacter sp.]MBL8570937.1 hypothetical protein [Phreatobacter sp.]
MMTRPDNGNVPTFVSREVAARECGISVDTWDAWAREGFVPQASIRRGGVLRWYWPDVVSRLASGPLQTIEDDPFMKGIADADKAQRRRAAS